LSQQAAKPQQVKSLSNPIGSSKIAQAIKEAKEVECLLKLSLLLTRQYYTSKTVLLVIDIPAFKLKI